MSGSDTIVVIQTLMAVVTCVLLLIYIVATHRLQRQAQAQSRIFVHRPHRRGETVYIVDAAAERGVAADFDQHRVIGHDRGTAATPRDRWRLRPLRIAREYLPNWIAQAFWRPGRYQPVAAGGAGGARGGT